MAELAACLDGVSKSFGQRPALSELSLELRCGEVLALLGPNGAGKTTAIGVLLGLRRPDRGRARLFGRDPRRPEPRRLIGVTPQETGFPGTLRVREIADLVRAHYSRPPATAELLERFGLAELAGRQAGGLSGGQRRLLAVALAFAGAPQAVFLDEPTSGLDLDARSRVWAVVRSYAAAGGTVLLTTHHLDEAEALASRVVLLDGGRAVADGAVAEIRARAGLTRIRVEASELPALAGVAEARRDGAVHTLYAADAAAVVKALVLGGVELRGLEVSPASLEEAFRQLTGGER